MVKCICIICAKNSTVVLFYCFYVLGQINKIINLGEFNILMKAFRVDKVDINMLINTIIMNYDLKNKYYEYLEKYFKILFGLESLTGEKYYNL